MPTWGSMQRSLFRCLFVTFSLPFRYLLVAFWLLCGKCLCDGCKQLCDKAAHKRLLAQALAQTLRKPCANLAETCAPTHPTNNGSWFSVLGRQAQTITKRWLVEYVRAPFFGPMWLRTFPCAITLAQFLAQPARQSTLPNNKSMNASLLCYEGDVWHPSYKSIYVYIYMV